MEPWLKLITGHRYLAKDRDGNAVETGKLKVHFYWKLNPKKVRAIKKFSTSPNLHSFGKPISIVARNYCKSSAQLCRSIRYNNRTVAPLEEIQIVVIITYGEG